MLRFWICACLSCLIPHTDLRAEPIRWSVGVASVDITPDYPVRLNGFGFRREESSGVRQSIHAQALAIGEDAETPAVLITVETLGIPDSLVERLSENLHRKVGLERHQLSVVATHTHTAPMVNDVSPTIFGESIPEEHQTHIDQYSREIEEKLEQVALQALADRRPGTLSWGVGQVGFAENRRTKGGPVDHDLPILVARDMDGNLRAIYVSYACHCVTLSDNLISGDWAGYARTAIERRHKNCVALVSIGCGADANPSSGVVGDRADLAQLQGAGIADEVKRLLQGPLTELKKPLSTSIRRTTLELAPLPSHEEWIKRAQRNDAVGFHARTMLARLDRGEKLTTQIPYSVQTWTFGDALAMVFLPGEVVVDYSKRLKQELDSSRLWINAYANGCPGYIPSERVLREGGYEGEGAMIYYGIPGPYEEGIEENVVAAVRGQVPKEFSLVQDASRTRGSLPRSPQETVASFRLKPGFLAEVVAAEPLIRSPVAIDFDQQGRLWVAEMYDYPSGVDNQFSPGGRIQLLTDTDGDGHYDAAKLFLEGIPFPTGITVWRDGVLICAAPDILFARDTDGDGRADDVRRLFTGFATQNYQARVNSLQYGLDGWVYGAAGLFGGEITCLETQDVVPLGQRDFRIDPDRGLLEPAGGCTQQGRARDDWGHWFGCNNSSLALHFPVEERYLSRNPFVHPPSTSIGIVTGPDGGRMYPVSDLVRFKLSGAPGTATAVCGLGIYRDELLGGDYVGNLFVCEPVNNLVHRRKLQPKDASFDAVRPSDEAGIEFLASSDQWFRPVQARTGPDGALWIVDMYRYVIEHPMWIPPETLAKLDVRAGADRGRIYRISPSSRSPRPITSLAGLTIAELIRRLESPNGPVRDMAQQMLLWEDESAASPDLMKLAVSASQPESRIHALHTLARLGELDSPTLVQSLQDGNEHVRRHSLRVAESMFDQHGVGEAVLECNVNSTPLKIQLANSLGEWSDSRAATRLADLAIQSEQSPYLRSAVFSSLNSQNSGPTTYAVLTSSNASEELVGQLLEQTASLADASAIQGILVDLALEQSNPRTFARVTLMFRALARRLRANPQLLDESSRVALRNVLDAARIHAVSTARDNDRVVAIDLLSWASHQVEQDTQLLASLLVPAQTTKVQQSVITALSRLGSSDVPRLLIDSWPSLMPEARADVMEALLSRPLWTASLLDGIRKKKVNARDLDLVSRQRLLEHQDAELREVARIVLDSTDTSDSRDTVVARYREAITPEGDPGLGREIFGKHCANCHRLQDVGNTVGPDLSVHADKPTDALLIALFNPNLSVDPRYHNYVIALHDGRVVNGMLSEETSNALTILNADGKIQTVLRVDIDELKNSGRSLMPEGFERDLTTDDVTHLVTYFRSLRAKPKQLDGNTPGLILGGSDDPLRLSADQAEVYGNEITFEVPFGNIGYWQSQDDFVRWRLELSHAEDFEVWLDWACHDSSAGNSFQLQAGSSWIDRTVLSTGGWDRYCQVNLGRIALPAGQSEIIVRPTSTVRGALLDLRSLRFVPVGQQPDFEVQVPPTAQLPKDPASVARYMMDETVPAEQRDALIRRYPDYADQIISVMTSDFAPGTPGEIRRIPWIWRVAIATGKRNQDDELRAVLTVAAPRPFEPMRAWQAVVIGGGLINGVSLAGGWPGERFAALLENNQVLQERWERAIDLAFQMADDERVDSGTRYDALRMVALATWDRSGPMLKRYLEKGVESELQMGAVSGLVDVPDIGAAQMLIESLGHLSDHNRELAVDGLLKSPQRITLLLESLENGLIEREMLGDEHRKLLHDHEDPAIRRRFSALRD